MVWPAWSWAVPSRYQEPAAVGVKLTSADPWALVTVRPVQSWERLTWLSCHCTRPATSSTPMPGTGRPS